MSAKPKRKQAKPLREVKKQPNMYIAAQIDRDTGVIHRTIRGRNFIVDADKWDDVTDDPRVLELFSVKGHERLLCKNGRLLNKPKIKIEPDTLEFEIEDGMCCLRFKVDGSTKYLPETIKVRINSKILDIEPNGVIELKSKVSNRLTVKVIDERVYVEEKPVAVMAVPKGMVGRTERKVIIEDNVDVKRRD